MPATLDQKMATRLLQAHGWRVGKRANHGIKMQRPGKRPVILPRHHGQPYGQSLNRAIIRQAGLDPKEVSAWISRSQSRRRGRDTGHEL